MEFDEIYTTYHSKIFRYLAKLIGMQEAEDLTQEVFVKVHKALDTFRNESQLSTWIYRIATNAAIDRMRSPSFQQKLISEQEDLSLNESEVIESKSLCFSGKNTSLEDQVVHKEMNTCIKGIIYGLPENYRTIVILSELEGFKDKEIADILGISLEMVKARLHRGRARLKCELEHHCNFSWDERNELSCDPKCSEGRII